MYKKLSALVLMIILLAGTVWIISGGIFHILSGRDFNESFSENIQFTSGWNAADTMVDDMLPFYDRTLWLRTKLTLATGSRKIGDVYINKERLIREPAVLDESSLIETAEYINSFYLKYSIPTCMTAFPEAAEIYVECLPENVTVPSQLEQLDKFYENVDTKIRTVNSYHVLSTFKEDYIYYRTDSRCTANGAYFVYRSLIRKMGYYPVPYDHWTISHMKNDVNGDLYDVCLYDSVTPDILDVYTCENSSEIVSVRNFNGNEWSEGAFYNDSVLGYGSIESYYIGKPCLLTEIETNVENGKNLLVFKDSYGDNMLPFFTQHYAKIDVIDISCLDRNISEFVEPSDYQQVLILCDADTFTHSNAFKFLVGNAVKDGERND